MEAKWNNYVTAPKKINFKIYLKKRCIELGLNCKISSNNVHRDSLDKIFGINKEVIYFDITGEYSDLVLLKNEIEHVANQWNKVHTIY